MPQFFSDTGNGVDSTWFFIACFIELIGLVLTIGGGLKFGGVYLIFATLSIIMFVFCDFFFAILLHRKKANICKTKTLLLLTNDNNAATIARLKLDLEKGKLLDILLISGIILFAIFKIIAVVLLGVFNSLILYLPVAIIYFIAAYIHIMHTGYFFAYRATQSKINKEYLEFANGEHKANIYRQPVVLESKLRDLPIKHYPHEIIQDLNNPNDANNPGKHHYLIVAKGVLEDSDITSLIAGQDAPAKIALFKACRELQVQSYGIPF